MSRHLCCSLWLLLGLVKNSICGILSTVFLQIKESRFFKLSFAYLTWLSSMVSFFFTLNQLHCNDIMIHHWRSPAITCFMLFSEEMECVMLFVLDVTFIRKQLWLVMVLALTNKGFMSNCFHFSFLFFFIKSCLLIGFAMFGGYLVLCTFYEWMVTLQVCLFTFWLYMKWYSFVSLQLQSICVSVHFLWFHL